MNLCSKKGQNFFLCKYRGFGNSCFSYSSYVYSLWQHYKVCISLNPTWISCVVTIACPSAWFCELEVWVIDYQWYRSRSHQNFVERIFFFLQAVSRLVFYKCTYYSFFEKHLFNHIWWSEVDFNIKFHHNNSCSKQISSSTSWTSLEALTTKTNFRTNL